MAKKTISALSTDIQNYAAKTEVLSIDPILDGGIKKDILDTLNNKAYNSAYLRLAALPTSTTPATETGANGEYFITQCGSFITALLFKKEAGVWNAKTITNDLTFFFDDAEGVRYYYAFSDDLTAAIQTNSINLANPTGTAVLTTPQTLTDEEKIQVQTNIDAASKSYIDNALAALKNSGAVGSSVAGSVMAWFGVVASIPQDWMLIPNEETFLLKADYPDLYTALGGEGNVFGVTDTLFALPYLAGGTSIIQTSELFPLGQKGGEETHVLDITEIPQHSHIINLDTTDGVESTGINAVNANTISGGSVQTENAGGGSAHNNMPPYIAANYIIKTKNTGGSFTASVDENNHLILTFADGSVQDAGEITTPNHNELAALQGGTVDERYHVPLKNYNDIVGTVQTITAPFNAYSLTDANNNLIIFNIETGAPSGGQYFISSLVTRNGTITMVIKNNHTSSIDVSITQSTTKSYPLSINEKIETGVTPITIAAGVSYIVRITKVGDYIIIQ